MSAVCVEVQEVYQEVTIDKKPFRILDGIDMTLRLGELTMLVGPSGCGKTTLISLISGILTATTGQIEVMGHCLTQMNDQEKTRFRRCHIGFIFQQYNLLTALNAEENVTLPLLAAAVPRSEALKQAKALLAELGMAEHSQKQPQQLSGGQQQRVAIARALIHKPSLIICDEPTSALDSATGKHIMTLLRVIANEAHRAVLIVTHDQRIYPFADRILEMQDGRMVGESTQNQS